MHTVPHIEFSKNFMLVVLLSLLIMLTIYLPFSQHGWGLNAFYYTNAEWKGKPVITKIDKNCFLKGNVKENILSAAVFFRLTP